MSELALEYYQERTARFDIDAVPTVLNGRPLLLLGDDIQQRLSLQRPDPECLEAVTQRYAQVLTSTAPYVAESFRQVRNDSATPTGKATGRLKTVNNRHVGTIVEDKLFPGHLRAGHIKNIQIEALAPDEVDAATIRRAGANTGYHRYAKDADINIYVRMTAELYAGRPLGYAACLTVVSAIRDTYPNGRHAIVPRYMGAAYKTNDLLAKSSISQSRAISNYIDVWGINTPLLQNVRRGGRQHGKQ